MISPHLIRSSRGPRGGRYRALALFATLYLVPLDPVSAELRVLLVFDAEGHRVQRVVRGGASLIERLREHERLGKHGASGAGTASGHGEASLTWLDEDGAALATERVPDPRLARVPVAGGRVGRTPPIGGSPADGVAHDKVRLDQGGWFVRGPEAATALLLRLPAREAPALAPDEWRFELDEHTLGKARR